MAFPSSPSDGQQITVGNVTYSYNASKTAWYRIGTVANPITSTVDYYTGDGVTATFALSAIPTSENYTFAAVGGVLQPRDRYSVAGTSLTFSSAPPVDAPIDITTFGGSGASIYSNNSVATYLLHNSGNIAAGNVLSGGYFWANGTPFASSNYGNTNVESYLPTSTTIITINSNIAGSNAAIITANSAMKSYVDAVTTNWTANAGVQADAIVAANAAILLRANIASPTFTGNVVAGNFVYANGVSVSNQIQSNTIHPFLLMGA